MKGGLTEPIRCLDPSCVAELPGSGDVYRRAREHGWARHYHLALGTRFVCWDHGGTRRTNPANDSHR